MRLTQGTFSFLPDLTDEQIASQIDYCLAERLGGVDRVHGRSASRAILTGRCSGMPMFDIRDAAGVHDRAARVPADLSRTTTSS